MRQNIIIVILIILIFLVSFIYRTIWQNKRAKAVLAYEVQQQEQTPEPTPTPLPSPSPTQSPTPKPTKKTTRLPSPSLTPSPTPTPEPQPQYTAEQIYEFYNRFGGQYGVSADVLRHIAECESGFEPLSINGQYAGLFQFNANTWSRYRTRMGEDPDSALRVNAEEAVQTAAYVLQVNEAYIWPNCVP